MALASLLALSACKEDDGYKGLPQQYDTSVCRFRQGYKKGWTATGGADGDYAVPEEKLAVKITKDADPEAGQYIVYFQKKFVNTLEREIALYKAVTNPDHKFYFNTRMGNRENFTVTNDEPIITEINGYSFYSATYTFTADGTDWQGQFYILHSGYQYHVIAYEAAADKWADFEPDFLDMMKDFFPTAYESGDVPYGTFDSDNYKLPQQYENVVFYFRQGFMDGWTLIGDPDGKYSNPDENLIIEIVKDSDPEAGRYSIYKQEETKNFDPAMASLSKSYEALTDPESLFYFNLRLGTRENFVITNEEPMDVVYNGYQMRSAAYTFTEDGADWQGQFYVLPFDRTYFILAWEARADVWADYEPDFQKLLDDFWIATDEL